ncbi:hypothetical protein BD779DRAFT_1475055 [Infundibulicybe gibba]|nr:hypothetical protein BD779DRAFT_1475055 [Infundibulicybe gibba]
MYTTGTMDFCEVAPRLTEVQLQEIYEHVTIKLPWNQLQFCSVDSPEVACYILQHAENLRMCFLDVASVPPDSLWIPDLPHGPYTYHLQLTTLTVLAEYADIVEFFSFTTLPSLQNLKVYFNYHNLDSNSFEDDSEDIDFDGIPIDDGLELAPTIFQFLERSSPQLSILKLTDIPFSESDLIGCLALVPSVVFLDIGFNGNRNVISHALLRVLDANIPGYVLPCLSSLAFRGPAGISEEALDALIASR